MRRDARGFYHFVDRIGDTFRWKGENVSTTEVLSVLTRIEGVLDGVVYGVPVAGAEGRAGMAALMVGPQFDLVRFRAALHRLLPGYARPPFIRLLPGIAATATHKPLKQELVLSGYDPALVRDPLYWDSPGDEAFVSIDAALFAALGTGTLRL
jgi:fatty-acyl-CoA synthase